MGTFLLWFILQSNHKKVIKKVKNTIPRAYVISDYNIEKIE